jgi:hypothetical protein
MRSIFKCVESMPPDGTQERLSVATDMTEAEARATSMSNYPRRAALDVHNLAPPNYGKHY